MEQLLHYDDFPNISDIDLEDPEVKAAAAKIQGNFLRRKMKAKANSEEKPAEK